MTNTPKINAALAKLQTQLPAIAKDLTAKVKSERTGTQYSYNYADLARISREVLPLLGGLGLAFTSRPTLANGEFQLVYELRHESGEQIDGAFPLPDPRRGTPQEIGGAITYARRYSLCAVTGVAPENDDSDAAAAERAARRQRTHRENPARGQNPPEEHPAITAEQQRDMQGLFQELGIADLGEKLRYAARVVRRQIKTSTELTQPEANQVIAKAHADLVRRNEMQQPSGDSGQAEPTHAGGTP